MLVYVVMVYFILYNFVVALLQRFCSSEGKIIDLLVILIIS